MCQIFPQISHDSSLECVSPSCLYTCTGARPLAAGAPPCWPHAPPPRARPAPGEPRERPAVEQARRSGPGLTLDDHRVAMVSYYNPLAVYRHHQQQQPPPGAGVGYPAAAGAWYPPQPQYEEPPHHQWHHSHHQHHHHAVFPQADWPAPEYHQPEAAQLPSPAVTVCSAELASPAAAGPVSPPCAAPRPPPVRSPYEWMKKPSYQSQPNPGKTRTKDKYRVVYSDHQRLELEKEFHYSRYITIRRKAELAANLGLSERQVKIWFQNRRAKERKQTKKREELLHKEKLEAAQQQMHVAHHHMTSVGVPGAQHAPVM
ncbi:homeobox protein CHOX-CAD [Bacillus rossius redtenbacheri]|uniref:homeobox protein CHOX-CAD n=1 Tax=Bacillus rossius redtenbacheri TaxID=93214 RepID=UPI002FDE64D7